jgi:hypothetical protein
MMSMLDETRKAIVQPQLDAIIARREFEAEVSYLHGKRPPCTGYLGSRLQAESHSSSIELWVLG